MTDGPEPIRPTRLAGAALPMLVWALHFVVAYSLVGTGCERGWPPPGEGRFGWLGISLWLATIVALALVAWIGHRAWRTRAGISRGEDDPVAARRRFVAAVTALLALAAAVAIVLVAAPLLMLPPCAA